MTRRALLIVCLALLPAIASAAYPPTPGTGTFTVMEGIEYANAGGKRLLLDLRVPDSPGPHPVILYLHSGAWITGDRTGGAAIRQASRGYAVASIDYRLAPQSTWPAQIEDCKAAVRWLRANAERFNLDPERIGVFGASAGGHLAAMLGTTSDRPEFEGLYLGNPQFSSKVKVVVDMYGPTDLLKIEEQKLPCGLPLNGNDPRLPPSLLMGCPIQECKEKTATSNPINYITPDDPPFLILHGLLDCLVPWKQSQILQEALEHGGVPSTFILLPRGEHGGSAFDEQEIKQTISDFLDEHLRGPLPPVRRRAVRR
jgi:acetyl esterase/lipase